MNKIFKVISFFIILLLAASFIKDDTYAGYHGFISNAWVNGHVDDNYGGTWFDVGLDMGCQWPECFSEDDFVCISSGYAYTYTITDWDVVSLGILDTGYEKFQVTLYGGQHWEYVNGVNTFRTEQNIQGHVQKRVTRTLQGYSVDQSGNLLGHNPDSSTVTYNSSAHIDRKAISGYTFLGWRADRTSGNPSGGTRYTVDNLKSNITVYAVYAADVTLSGVAVDKSGNELGTSHNPTPSTVAYNTTATIYKKNVDNYKFLGWRTNKTSGNPAGGNSYTVNNLKTNTTVYAVYERNIYQAQIKVKGDVTDQVGYTKDSTTKVAHITNCSPTVGCEIYFEDYIKRTSGEGTTSYTVSRSSNLTSKVAYESSVAAGTSNTDGSEKKIATDPSSGRLTLYPGMVVCENIAFKAYSNSTSNNNVELCVSAEGKAQPDDPADPHNPNNPMEDPNGDDESDALVDIQVKNETVDKKYKTYRRVVYAKPGDKVTYRATYNPILQYTCNLRAQQMKIGGGGVVANSSNITLEALFNANKGSLKNWKNAFSVEYSFNSSIDPNLNNCGDTAKKRKINSKDVEISHAGMSLDEIAGLNRSKDTKTTPVQITFSNNSERNLATIDVTTEKKSVASAKVPYNFDTELNMKKTIDTYGNAVVYAGERASSDADVFIKPKTNSYTTNSDSEKYATKVGNPKYRLIVYYGGVEKDGTVYGGDNLCSYFVGADECGYASDITNAEEQFKNVSSKDGLTKNMKEDFYVKDLSAGKKVCIAAAFYPSDSGADNNLDKIGSGKWRISNSVCYDIAKRPNMQILGGNVYSVGYGIDTAVSAKNNVAGVEGADYHISRPNNNTYVFGSWGELGVISVGSVNGLASGAGTGYSGANLAANPGGSLEREIDFCKRSTLSFANSQCTYGRAGLLGENVSIGANEDRINVEKLEESSDAAEIDTEESDQGIIIKESRVSSGTNIVKSSGDIQISGNLYYDGAYATLDSVPKIVIYAKGNIYINCNVENVDALLVAGETVVTCGDFETDIDRIGNLINAGENSNQLKVYGAIIANKIIANRTYGAATGDNSIVPAEIINFDPTLYLWGVRTTGESSISGEKLKITSTKELPPRF